MDRAAFEEVLKKHFQVIEIDKATIDEFKRTEEVPTEVAQEFALLYEVTE